MGPVALIWWLPSDNCDPLGTPSGRPVAVAGIFQNTQWAWSSVVLLRARSRSCMCRKKLCVPAGALAHFIAGDVPSPGATPAAAWLNLTGIWPPSGNPEMVRVMADEAGAGPPLGGPPCADSRTVMESVIDSKRTNCMRLSYRETRSRAAGAEGDEAVVESASGFEDKRFCPAGVCRIDIDPG